MFGYNCYVKCLKSIIRFGAYILESVLGKLGMQNRKYEGINPTFNVIFLIFFKIVLMEYNLIFPHRF